jgi:hypothetical protein
VRSPRIRTIKPELWQDQDLQLLPVHARLLFIGLLSNADDEGRLEGHSGLIRARIFPCDADVTNRRIEGWLEALEEGRFVALYAVSGRPYIEITNWLKHQKINRPTASSIPDPSLNGHGAITEHSLRIP